MDSLALKVNAPEASERRLAQADKRADAAVPRRARPFRSFCRWNRSAPPRRSLLPIRTSCPSPFQTPMRRGAKGLEKAEGDSEPRDELLRVRSTHRMRARRYPYPTQTQSKPGANPWCNPQGSRCGKGWWEIVPAANTPRARVRWCSRALLLLRPAWYMRRATRAPSAL